MKDRKDWPETLSMFLIIVFVILLWGWWWAGKAGWDSGAFQDTTSVINSR